jgi:predicted Zn finger-like uncharacterized protein
VSEDLRAECPECGCSYKVANLKIKTGPADKAVVRCMCGGSLEIAFDHVEVPEYHTWTQRLFRRPQKVTTQIHARVSTSV